MRGKKLTGTHEMADGAGVASCMSTAGRISPILNSPASNGGGEEGGKEKLGDIRTTASFMGADFVQQGSCVWPRALGN